MKKSGSGIQVMMVRRVFVAFLVFGLVACGDDGVGVTEPESVFGTYTLQSIDGEGLPAVFSEVGGPTLVEITAGSVTLNQDMTCSLSLTFRTTFNGIVDTDTITNECIYTFDNGALTLTSTTVPEVTFLNGSISGSTLTATQSDREGAVVFVFER